MTHYSIQEYVSSAAARRESYDALSETASQLLASVKMALANPDSTEIPGWRIKRIPIYEYEAEVCLCESTAANIPYSVEPENSLDMLVIVKRGKLHVSYNDALGGFDLTPGRAAHLPGGVHRTTFAAEHPTTLFAVIHRRASCEQSAEHRPVDRGQNY